MIEPYAETSINHTPGTREPLLWDESHMEDITGSIEVGKSAELAVLDSDIETIPVEQIQDIAVLETVFMGKTVFKKD